MSAEKVSRAVIHLIGDSTVCVYPADSPREGWGMKLAERLRPGVEIRNHAISGRSTKSFRENGDWAKFLPQIGKGDFVVIDMGLNDGSPKETRPQNHTDVGGEFEGNLARWIEEVRERGGIPLLTTNTVIWDAAGRTEPDPHRESYNRAIRETAERCRCELVDLHSEAFRRLTAMTAEEAQAIYVPAIKDFCHLSPRGAKFYADIFVELCRRRKTALAPFFL